MSIGHKMSRLSSTLQKGCRRFRYAAAAAAAWDNGDLWSPLLQKAQKGISLWDLIGIRRLDLLLYLCLRDENICRNFIIKIPS